MPNDNDFFDTNIKILKFSGVWIPEKGTPKHKVLGYALLNTFWIVYCFFIFTPAEFCTLPITAANLNDFIKNINMALTHGLACIKITIWFVNRKDILYIMDTLRSNVVSFEGIGDFDPAQITKDDKKVKDFWTKLFLLMGCFVSVSSCVGSYITLFFDYESQWDYEVDAFNNTKIIYNQKLPYYSLIPWNFRTSRLSFGMAVLFQFFPLFNFAFIIIGFDTLFTSMMSYASCQIKIVQGIFRTIRERTFRRLNIKDAPVLRDPEFVRKELNIELNKGIKALQVIFIMCEKLEAIFTYVMLVQVFISLTVFCTCLYLVSSVPLASAKFAAEMVYLIAIEIQLWLYCYFGNMVTERGDEIPLSLYEGDWLAADKSFTTSMMITMTRMRRPIFLTLGKFSPLTLTTFVTISRGSYSFFTFLKQSND